MFSGFHHLGEEDIVFIFSLIIKNFSSFSSERHPKPKGSIAARSIFKFRFN